MRRYDGVARYPEYTGSASAYGAAKPDAGDSSPAPTYEAPAATPSYSAAPNYEKTTTAAYVTSSEKYEEVKYGAKSYDAAPAVYPTSKKY